MQFTLRFLVQISHQIAHDELEQSFRLHRENLLLIIIAYKLDVSLAESQVEIVSFYISSGQAFDTVVLLTFVLRFALTYLNWMVLLGALGLVLQLLIAGFDSLYRRVCRARGDDP